MKRAAIAALLLTLTRTASAQVGYPPTQSPYRDLVFRQELSAVVGQYFGSTGRAGVGPRGGLAFGVRHEIRIGGPVQLTSRLVRVWSERLVLDPTRPDAERNIGIQDRPLYLADIGFSMNLTGRKSFHRLVPVVNAGLGVVSSLGEDSDPGGYEFGTTFALAFGGGIRWVPGGRLQLRLDVGDYLYQLSYPDAFFVAPPGGTPVLTPGRGTKEWKHNALISLGISYLFSR